MLSEGDPVSRIIGLIMVITGTEKWHTFNIIQRV
jgi:hypothetical protein